jgi:hypothetical protein
MRTVLRTASEFFDSRRRGVCVWVGFAVLFGLTMFPPWIKYEGARQVIRTRLWHARADRDPTIYDDGIVSGDVDYRRMLTEIATGEGFVLALYLTWGKRKQSSL